MHLAALFLAAAQIGRGHIIPEQLGEAAAAIAALDRDPAAVACPEQDSLARVAMAVKGVQALRKAWTIAEKSLHSTTEDRSALADVFEALGGVFRALVSVCC
jgi:hypothetical protein